MTLQLASRTWAQLLHHESRQRLQEGRISAIVLQLLFLFLFEILFHLSRESCDDNPALLHIIAVVRSEAHGDDEVCPAAVRLADVTFDRCQGRLLELSVNLAVVKEMAERPLKTEPPSPKDQKQTNPLQGGISYIQRYAYGDMGG